MILHEDQRRREAQPTNVALNIEMPSASIYQAPRDDADIGAPPARGCRASAPRRRKAPPVRSQRFKDRSTGALISRDGRSYPPRIGKSKYRLRRTQPLHVPGSSKAE